MPYKNAEKRKEKSRDAARNRRGKEADVFGELSALVPISTETVASMDKASIMRIAISHLKLRMLMKRTELEEQSASDALLNREYLRALGGYVMLLDAGGDIMFVSDDVTKVLGINQLELLGASLYDFTHPCDHDELRETLDEKDAEEDCRAREHTFFIRHKCTLTSKGRNVNLKSATYKLIRYTGHHVMTEDSCCLVLIGESIPQPSNMGVPLDSFSFLTQHTMDLRFSYCDERMTELLGYSTEEVMSQPLCEFHHAWDGEAMEKSLKGLYSKGQMWTERYRFLAKGGGYVWAETQATVIHNAKTEKPQCIICLHYVLSGVEDRGCIMSHVQIKMEKDAACLTESLCRKTAVVKPTRKAAGGGAPRDGPVMSTESVFVPSKGVGCAPDGMGYRQRAVAAGDSLVPMLDPDEVEVVNLIEDVLFHDTGVGMRTSGGGDAVAGKAMDMSFTRSLAGLDVNDDVTVPENEPVVRPSTAHAFAKCAPVDGIPNLEHLADNPRSSPASAGRKHLLPEQTTLDVDDVDMDMRAPYIPMSGDEDLIFSMMPPVPLIDEMDNSTGMLGITESVFAPKPVDPDEEQKEKPQIPMSVLRAEAMSKQAKQLTGLESANAQTLPKANALTETNRLETGPPAAKRPRRDVTDVAYLSDEEDLYSSPSSCASALNMVNPDDILSGSMVLKNLLVTGHDASTGYDILNVNSKTQQPAKSADSSTLRGLLTGPMENLTPPMSPTYKAQSPVVAADQTPPLTPPPPLQQAKQGSIEVSSTSDVITSNHLPRVVSMVQGAGNPAATNATTAAAAATTAAANQGATGPTVRRITIKTVGSPSTDANQIVLTDDIIRMLIKYGQAQVLIYNQ